MKQLTSTPRSRKRVIRDFVFDGCAVSVSFPGDRATHPIGLSFRESGGGKEYAARETIGFVLTRAEAVEVHRRLGAMIERSQHDSARDANDATVER